MPEVLFILPDHAIGGAERILTRLADHVAQTEMKPRIIILSDSGGDGYGTRVPREVLGGGFRMNLIRRLPARLSRLTSDDVVVSSQFHINVWIGLLKAVGLVRVRTIARESTRVFERLDGWRRQSARRAVNWFYPHHDLVIAQTRQMADDLRSASDRLRVEVFANPVERRDVDQSELPAEAPWMGRPHIVAAGRLIAIKGHDILIRAMALLSADCHLVILGEGPERDRLAELSRSSGIGDRVWMPGTVPDPRPYFAAADACAVSSRLEGFPNVLLEMMTVQTAVVSTLCADGIENLPGVITCEPGDPAVLSAALNQALTLDPSERERRRGLMSAHLAGRTFDRYWSDINRLLQTESKRR
jgi:glycosyltransferase involved in cell wall biosynthesis